VSDPGLVKMMAEEPTEAASSPLASQSPASPQHAPAPASTNYLARRVAHGSAVAERRFARSLQGHSTEAENRRMAWTRTARRRHVSAAIPLLCLCGLLAVIDFFLLGIAVAFGPGGFGGDGTVSSGRAAWEQSGVLAGLAGLGVAVVALLGFLALARHRRRNDVLAFLVGAQGLMLIWLVASVL
jgi:hypothetical protein